MNTIFASYLKLCPVCKNDLITEEIEAHECFNTKQKLYPEEFIEGNKDLYKNWEEFFTKIIDKPKMIQKVWAKRVLNNQSFAALAPTGSGKTTFGYTMAIFFYLLKKRTYIILPTTLLIKQTVENIFSIIKKLNLSEELYKNQILYFHSDLKKKEKEHFFENLNHSYILITSTQFLSKHFDKIYGFFDFIFIDDVDSILKNSKNIERILHLCGFYYDEIKNEWQGESKSTLMVSTATGNPGKKTKLFYQLLNFDVGSTNYKVRDIEDLVIPSKKIQTIKTILKNFSYGGIIFCQNIEEAKEIYNTLKDEFKIGLIHSEQSAKENSKILNQFKEGNLDFLIGISTYYGVLVRGIDIPERILFVIFYGIPSFKVRLNSIDSLKDTWIIKLALQMGEIEEIKNLFPISIHSKNKIQEVKELIKKYISNPEYLSKFNIDLLIKEDTIFIPDIRTYIQASGRTSRLFHNGLTKGVSFILENDRDLINTFVKRASYFDINIKQILIENISFNKIFDELIKSRIATNRTYELVPALLIVESPTKVKQIAKFFGKANKRKIHDIIIYEVPTDKYILNITACLGHITDLSQERGIYGVEKNSHYRPIYTTIKRCIKCNHQFLKEIEQCPKCGYKEIINSKERIKALRKIASESEMVIIGTDPDNEGEKIAWDLYNLLFYCSNIYRMEFHEVTYFAIKHALDQLKNINYDYVKAQIVRRIEDRWIGFTLSNILKNQFHSTNLSAGRAQTPVLGWIIERLKQYNNKKIVGYCKEYSIRFELNHTIPIKKSSYPGKLNIKRERQLEEEHIPLPPYTTDTLLKDINDIIKIDLNQAMKLLQELFENGLITYHRTDSIYISQVGHQIAKDYLKEDYYKRNWQSEGAHECIRPTKAYDKNQIIRMSYEGFFVSKLNRYHFLIYDLIFRRFMASLCKPYKIEKVVYNIKINIEELNFVQELQLERIINVQGKAVDLYKSFVIHQPLEEGIYNVEFEFKKVPSVSLYTQADIVQMMKEKGIGRPSTYATILHRLFQRGYIIERKGKLIPTKKGEKVYYYLIEHYKNLITEERTRQLETKLDQIETNQIFYLDVIDELYKELKSLNLL